VASSVPARKPEGDGGLSVRGKNTRKKKAKARKAAKPRKAAKAKPVPKRFAGANNKARKAAPDTPNQADARGTVKKPALTPWERVNMTRSSWYRAGRPTA